jgi:hypothetical protein
MSGITIEKDLDGKTTGQSEFEEDADYAVIEDAYRRACREFSPSLSISYAEHLAPDEGDIDEEALVEAHTVIASLGLVPSIRTDLEDVAENLANEWLEEHGKAIKSLNDERQEAFRQLRELSREPRPIDLARPQMRLQMTRKRNESGIEEDLPRFPRHLLSDPEGMFPLDVDSTWETTVLNEELQREDSIAWYRNPPRASQDSLGVAYQEGEEQSILRPDFIFFVRLEDGSVAADLVDPHGTHLADALPKLKGLANYAAENAASYRRIEAVSMTDEGVPKMLDMTDEDVRNAVTESSSAKALFKSEVAQGYPPSS